MLKLKQTKKPYINWNAYRTAPPPNYSKLVERTSVHPCCSLKTEAQPAVTTLKIHTLEVD